MPSSDDAFAQAFDAVVRHTGQTLTGIRSRLDERGISISTATLSYWRSGARRPDARSLAAVTAIEGILELIPGTLSRHVAGRSRRVGTVAPPVDIGATDDAARDIFAALDASDLDDARTLSVQEFIDVDERGSVSAVATMLLLQCVRNRFERIAIALPSPVPTSLAPIVEVPGGGEIGAIVRHPHGYGVVIELARPLQVGETAMLAIDVRYPHGYPQRRMHSTSVRRPAREVVRWFRFAHGYAPDWIEEVEVTRAGERVLTTEVDAQPGVHRVRTDFGPGAIRTTWGLDSD